MDVTMLIPGDGLDAVVTGIFWLVALVLLVLAAFVPMVGRREVRLVPLALALFVLPFVWDAFSAG
jgi:hypothetical protein